MVGSRLWVRRVGTSSAAPEGTASCERGGTSKLSFRDDGDACEFVADGSLVAVRRRLCKEAELEGVWSICLVGAGGRGLECCVAGVDFWRMLRLGALWFDEIPADAFELV